MVGVEEVGGEERGKRLGAFFTPPDLARAVVAWAVRSAGDRVLDPAAGEAVFLQAAVERLKDLGSQEAPAHVRGIELDPRIREEALALLGSSGSVVDIHLGDFFGFRSEDFATSFDAVVGNPPYVRYHRFRGDARRRARDVAASRGVWLSGLASAWAPFVIHASTFVAPGGRLALVLPAELLHVDYASPVREFLLRRFARVTVVAFEEAVFPGALIDAVLLLAEDGSPGSGLRLVMLEDLRGLGRPLAGEFTRCPPQRWSQLRSDHPGTHVLRSLEQEGVLQPLAAVGSVDIGAVTGANSYFLLTAREARALEVRRNQWLSCVARPAQLAGAIVTAGEMDALSETTKAMLLHLTDAGMDREGSPLGRYLATGVSRGVHERYKCRVRHPWYMVPGARVPDIFISYMSHRAPRVVLNLARATSTNLVHHLMLRDSALPCFRRRALLTGRRPEASNMGQSSGGPDWPTP
jgi:adenine-specific DNA methylase